MANNGNYQSKVGAVSDASEPKPMIVPMKSSLEHLESGFGAWDKYGKFLYWSHCCWLLKEAFWILLISPGALIFGALSLGLSFFANIGRRDGGVSGKLYGEVGAEVLVGLIQFSWLFFNVLWMLLTFLYEEPENTPGYAESLVNWTDCYSEGCESTYNSLMWVVRIGFVIAFVAWLGACGYLLKKWIEPPKFVAQGYQFQTCLLEGGWMAFWIAKDFAWSFDEEGFPFALTAWILSFSLLAFSLVQASAGTIIWDGIDDAEMAKIQDVVTCNKPIDLVYVSYLMWSISSLLWLLMETVLDDDLTMRYVAAVVALVACALFLKGYTQAKHRAEALHALQKQFEKLSTEDASDIRIDDHVLKQNEPDSEAKPDQ